MGLVWDAGFYGGRDEERKQRKEREEARDEKSL